MKSLRKTKWKSRPVLLGVFIMLVTLACIEGIEPIPANQQANVDTYSGVQSVIITNSTGTLLEDDREITANITYPAEGEVEINLCAKFDGHKRVCRLEGSITNNIIIVKNIDSSRSYTFENDEYMNTSFKAFFGLSEFNLELDCPVWSGKLVGDQLEISSDFCCDDPESKDSAIGKVSCSLVRM